MSFEDLKVGIAMLLDQMQEHPEDELELQESLREKLAEMRGMGLPVPDDLVELEKWLEEDLTSKGRRSPGEQSPENPEKK